MTPICKPRELHAMGFKIVAYPLSMLAVRRGDGNFFARNHVRGYPDEELLPTFEELKDAVGMNEYLEESKKYKLGSSSMTRRINPLLESLFIKVVVPVLTF